MKRTLLIAASFLLPLSASAQTPAPDNTIDASNLGNFSTSLIDFINGVLVPLVFALAFIVFIWGIFQYFVAGGANEEQRDKGKQLAVWGIVALFVMMSVWGLVNLVRGSFDFGSTTTPDLPTFQVSGSGSSN